MRNMRPIITVASAQCRDAQRRFNLFQQFVTGREKPLKRLRVRLARRHRAEATVIMREVTPDMKYPGSGSLRRCLSGAAGDETSRSVDSFPSLLAGLCGAH